MIRGWLDDDYCLMALNSYLGYWATEDVESKMNNTVPLAASSTIQPVPGKVQGQSAE